MINQLRNYKGEEESYTSDERETYSEMVPNQKDNTIL